MIEYKDTTDTRSTPDGILYDKSFVSPGDKAQILSWLKTLHPIWEMRYSKNHPPPPDDKQRRLLRPVYWLGNWQFACLGYFHPPKGQKGRCVRAEPYPPVLRHLINKTEKITRRAFPPSDIPKNWHLNTCLVNFYGDQTDGEKPLDTARVGEHKDFELGPVASISLGERAFFQFVESSSRKQAKSNVVQQMWLDDRSLQVFGGRRWKEKYFHRVQRVDRRDKCKFELNVEGFETRRVNFTFRYVPEEFIVPFAKLPHRSKADVLEYVEQLSLNSEFFEKALKG